MIFEYANEIRDCLIKGKVGTTDRLLYNAEILSKIFMVALNPHQLRCTSCNIVKTPEWRKGPLGPRTLCNACGLIWGKLSRSKAALAAKSKQESNTKAAESEMPAMDSQTTAATTARGVEIPKRPATDPITLTDIARKKRGRGRSTTRDDGEDTGSGTMLNGSEAPGSAGQNGSSSFFPHMNGQSGSQGQAEDVIMSGGVSPPPPQPSFRPSNGEPHTVKEGGYQIDPLLAAAGPVPPPQSPDTLPFSTHENHDKEGSVAGRKLNLSYLLA
ncbi:hypothetical protein KI688_000441 [Linnemannia hyalina]|uniref:GATA-type domain-containing protein n=1 Tax=Linnemannia hyalina TaxID=64524 RepID=A0A9P8BXG6_9FUNG|nr:hypothetical protein KI688_000441 [Linnemannia hyalina]